MIGKEKLIRKVFILLVISTFILSCAASKHKRKCKECPRFSQNENIKCTKYASGKYYA